MTVKQYNVAQALTAMAERAPFRPAIIFPAGRDKNHDRAHFTQWTFQQLNELCDRYAHGLRSYGIDQGERTLLMVRPGIDLLAITFALLKIGAVPILIDPGMERKAFLQCVTEAEPTAFIGIPRAQWIRTLFSKHFKSIQKIVTVGRRFFWDGVTLEEACPPRHDPFPVTLTTVDDEAAVAFTSGGTGLPKGVVYTHGNFQAQLDVMRRGMKVAEGEVHLAVMYIFALFNPALGVTTVIPDMDPAHTADLNPAYLVEAIQTHAVTVSLGSPLIWKRVAEYCKEQDMKLPSLKHIFMFGAPVWPEVVQTCHEIMLDGKIYAPFGATEALPLTLIDETELLSQTADLTRHGAGVCVGHPIKGVEIQIIPILEGPIDEWDDDLCLPTGDTGEIVVKGKVVTERYLNRPQQTAATKIPDEDGGVWHRMGDVGYLDEQGRLWLCGRKAHRVQTPQGVLFPIPCEAVFNQHPLVERSALVGIREPGKQQPVLIVETRPEHRPKSPEAEQEFIAALLTLGAQYEFTRHIRTVLFHPSFPVDVRHNTKIQRHELAQWAQKRLT